MSSGLHSLDQCGLQNTKQILNVKLFWLGYGSQYLAEANANPV